MRRRLRDRVQLQTATNTEGEYEDLQAWLTTAERACEIKPLRASEYYQGSGENVDAIYEIRFRYQRGLFTETMRLLDARVSPNRIFDNIVIIDPGNRHTDIVITATERRWPTRV